MKPIFMLLCTVFFLCGFGQGKKDLTKALSSAERKAVLETLKKSLQPNLGFVPKLVVKKLVTKAGFAYFAGRVKDPNGADIDFSKTAYKQALKDGVFDGDATTALLKKTG